MAMPAAALKRELLAKAAIVVEMKPLQMLLKKSRFWLTWPARH